MSWARKVNLVKLDVAGQLTPNLRAIWACRSPNENRFFLRC
jgi:hypothetical protein